MIVYSTERLRAGNTVYIVSEYGVISKVIKAHIINFDNMVNTHGVCRRVYYLNDKSEYDFFYLYTFKRRPSFRYEQNKLFFSRRRAVRYQAEHVRQEKYDMLEALLTLKSEIARGINRYNGAGICNAMARIAHDYHGDSLKESFTSWEKYSGNVSYPIYDKSLPEKAYDQFENASNEFKMWDMSTEYGRLRHELLDHSINYFKAIEV